MAARRFFLERAPPEGPPRLQREEALHVLRVLRLSTGDEILGLDGRGNAWPLRIAGVSGREPELEATGPVRAEPPPGAAGASLPWIEVLVSWPRSARAEPMLDRLVQLGAAAVVPLVCAARGPEPLPAGRRRARLVKIAESACKQCGRLWLPEIREPTELCALARDPSSSTESSTESRTELSRSAPLVLDPMARKHLVDWLATSGPVRSTRETPLELVVGPEGGFSREERDVLAALGAQSVCVHPNVLRVETAAETALALCAAHYHSRSRSDT